MLQVTRTQPVLAPMREMFNTIADGLAGASANTTLPVDILEKEGHYEIRASVPGFTREQVSLELDNGVLSIGAEKTAAHGNTGGEGGADGCGDGCLLRQERYDGSLTRQIRLPAELDGGSIEAGLENGVLTITLVKPDENPPRRIPIT